MLDKIKLSTQLGAGFGVILLLLTGLVWLSTSVLNTTQNHLDQVVNDKNIKVSTVRSMLEHQLEINSRMRNLIFLDNDSEMQREQREFYRQWEEYGVLFKKIDDMNLDAEDEQLVAEIMTLGKAAMAINEGVLKPAMANQNEKAVEILMNRGVPANGQWKNSLTTLAEHQQAASKQFADQAQADYQQALTLILALFGLVVVVSVGVAISVVRSVLGQLGGEPREVAGIARHIAAGDLSSEIQVKSGDSESIMAAMQQVQNALKQLVSDSLLLSHEATEGKLSVRADASRHHGDYRQIIQGVNDTLESIVKPTTEANRILVKISGGDLSERMEMDCNGDHRSMKHALNGVHGWLTELIEFVTRISQGDLTADIPPASSHDQIHPWLMLLKNRISLLVADTRMLSDAIVNGELDKHVDADAYEGEYRKIIDSFDMAFTGLNQTFHRIVDTAQQVGQTVHQLNAASQNMAATSEEQSATVEEVTTNVNETDSQVKSNTESAIAANQLVVSASEVANQGRIKMEAMVEAMGAINQSSQNIAKIIKVIDEIAFQTNLLALNAAVEAARAGQHGRGFTVVAQEVRNLAGRSARAARETAELIEKSTRRVNEGVEIATHTRESLEQIVTNVLKVKDLVAEIAVASSEQSQGVSQINVAMLQVSRTALSSNQQAEELAATAQELTTVTNTMREEIGRFRLRNQHPSNRTQETAIVEKPAAVPKAHHQTLSPVSANMSGSARKILPLDVDERGFEGF